MSIFRTIKLLGWGSRAKQQIDQIRQEEMDLLRKFKVVELLTGTLKYDYVGLMALILTSAVLSAF